ncbi:MAG: fumarylacetoacetate hydrolase family protein [Chlorobiota bacterium]|nr:MAG: fumarylacetoacetate hydrolase family protein [Chlorobiota bacterium]
MKIDFQKIATFLYQNDLDKTTCKMISEDFPNLSISDAYLIQEELKKLHLIENKLIGMKMGLTSKAKMIQMNVTEPIYGFLTSKMMLKTDSTLSLTNQIHPKVEPEIALILKDDVTKILSYDEALNVIDYACSSIEVIDSRFNNFKFTLPDVISDNTSATKFVLGNERIKVSKSSLANLKIILKIDNQDVEVGNTSDVLEDPINSLCELSMMLEKNNLVLLKGFVILTGGATAAHSVKHGDLVSTVVESVGDCSLNVI